MKKKQQITAEADILLDDELPTIKVVEKIDSHSHRIVKNVIIDGQTIRGVEQIDLDFDDNKDYRINLVIVPRELNWSCYNSDEQQVLNMFYNLKTHDQKSQKKTKIIKGRIPSIKMEKKETNRIDYIDLDNG